MSFPNNNPYNQPIAGSSLGQDALEQMKNALSQRDQLIAQLMQQAEDEEQNNPWGSSNNKGKGRSIPLQDNTANCSLPSSSRAKPLEKTRRTQTPTPHHTQSVKCNLIQMLMQDAPSDFKYTKEALFVHIKLLWGMLTPAAIPLAPDKQLLKEFYQQFSSIKEVQSVAQNSQGVKLINEAQVQTLCNAHSGKRKIGKNIINIQEFYITYVHAMLAKLGICIWAPAPCTTRPVVLLH
ncbi:hypothetical protein O181_081148 [Austropuccinia psidii MF-1]|uniref:Uncharacterized protein n=1 Tax=Austropuccinia psidii MF-1 TaxID=1389203 RepID=A0A9Q3IH63_9BASI|nr:hypothetical protein [Austropuccinia psidii MF-1]